MVWLGLKLCFSSLFLILHCSVQPALKGETLNKGNCRELVGGLKIKAVSLLKHVVLERSVKFRAVVGRSDFSLSPTLIDLGSTRIRGKKFSGSFTISNLSTLLPLHYTIEPTKKVVLAKTAGTLDGLETPNGRTQERKI